MSKNHVCKRGGRFIYRKRVPAYVAHLDVRKEIKIALKTDNYNEAVVRAAVHDEQVESFWRALIQSGKSQNSQEKYKSAVRLARAYGFTYKSAVEMSVSALEEIVSRLLVDLHFKPAPNAEAILGGAGESTLQLSDCLELYWNLSHDKLKNKSEHKIRKWKNPRRLAMNNFIEVVGDKRLQDINRADVLAFRSWWNERIKKGLGGNGANKQMRFVKDILRTVSINNEIDIDCDALFTKTNFYDAQQSRPPFEASFVQTKLLPGLEKLNERDRYALFAMADTGARESEIFGLRQEDIKLDEEIPYIWIRARPGYALKTKNSERKIPLVGTALIAFKKFPNGFEHQGNPDTFSNIVNKYLRENNLRPTEQHSAYSLRHTFKDRLRDIEAPEEIIDELMGHKKSGPKYGRGHKLETKYGWLKKIAYELDNS